MVRGSRLYCWSNRAGESRRRVGRHPDCCACPARATYSAGRGAAGRPTRGRLDSAGPATWWCSNRNFPGLKPCRARGRGGAQGGHRRRRRCGYPELLRRRLAGCDRRADHAGMDLDPRLHWAPRCHLDKLPTGLFLSDVMIASLHQRLDGEWLAYLEQQVGNIRAPLVSRCCTSFELGQRGCELWAMRHLDRLLVEVQECHRRYRANRHPGIPAEDGAAVK